MTQSRQPEDRDILTRVTALEFQMVEIRNSQIQVRATFAPGGYISDGFERVVEQLRSETQESEGRLVNRIDGVEERLRFESQIKHDELNTKIDEVKEEIQSQGAKLDMILRRLSGESNLE